MAKRAALILAGGKARRFQSIDKIWQDKALAEISGKPLLVHAIENMQGIVDEVLVSINDLRREEKYAAVLKSHDLSNGRFVVDEQVSGISGPNVAIMSGLKAVKADLCFTLPCDMPFVQPKVADYLFCRAVGFDVTVPMWPNGRLETLMMVLESKSALEITKTLCLLKRPRSDDIPRAASKILLVSPLEEIKMLDPDLKSFVNINSKDDLYTLRTRHANGSVKEDRSLDLGILSVSVLERLQKAVQLCNENRFLEAQTAFSTCVSNFEALDKFFWAGVSGEGLGETLLKHAKESMGQEAITLDNEAKEAFLHAANNYRAEAEIYGENCCRLLEERALADKTWCESWAMGKTGQVHRYPSKVK